MQNPNNKFLFILSFVLIFSFHFQTMAAPKGGSGGNSASSRLPSVAGKSTQEIIENSEELAAKKNVQDQSVMEMAHSFIDINESSKQQFRIHLYKKILLEMVAKDLYDTEDILFAIRNKNFLLTHDSLHARVSIDYYMYQAKLAKIYFLLRNDLSSELIENNLLDFLKLQLKLAETLKQTPGKTPKDIEYYRMPDGRDVLVYELNGGFHVLDLNIHSAELNFEAQEYHIESLQFYYSVDGRDFVLFETALDQFYAMDLMTGEIVEAFTDDFYAFFKAKNGNEYKLNLDGKEDAVLFFR